MGRCQHIYGRYVDRRTSPYPDGYYDAYSQELPDNWGRDLEWVRKNNYCPKCGLKLWKNK